ncbi:MAG: diguanylate cyclase [Methylobacter sp.]|nr:diguanylate cyclase [Methylobacter sp.]
MINKLRRYIILLLLGLYLFAPHILAADKVLDASQLNQTPVVLTEYFAVLEDPSQTLTLDEVQLPDMANRFRASQTSAAALNYGYTHSAYWLRLNLRNASKYPLQMILEIGIARLESIQFHHPVANGTYRTLTTGSAAPFRSRPYKNRFFVFPVTLPAHADQVYYLRFQSKSPIIIPARLWNPLAFHAYERNDYIGQAWYFGMVTAMILFNLLLFIALRDVIYLLYVNLVTCTAFSLASQNGLTKEFLWHNSPLWSITSTVTGYSLTVAALLAFMRYMLNTEKIIPKIDRLLKVLVVFFLFFPVVFVISYQGFVKLAVLLYGIMLILVIIIGLYCAFKRQRSAYFFVAAYVIFCFSGVIGIMAALGILPTNILTINAWQFGSALEMLLLAFALADRFNVIRQEKEKAQREAFTAQQLLVENLKSSEHMLETRVAERTAELQILNRKLETLSATDGLTGIANRRHFDATLESEWHRAKRQGQPLALAMLDVDWFKKYNDHYGHQAGDECLSHVAGILAANVCRNGDLVARYGGEEFVFIAPGTDDVTALNMARKICVALQSQALPHEISEFKAVTASIGVATIVPKEGLAADILLKAADKALYSAKEQGRNQAVLHCWSTSLPSL